MIERIAEHSRSLRIHLREDEESILASCTGPDLGVLIGKHGQTINAIRTS